MRKPACLWTILGLLLVVPLAVQAAVLISVNSSGTGSGNGPSRRPQASSGGDWVVFESDATDLVTPPNASGTNVFVRYTQGAFTTLLSLNFAGTGSGNGPSVKPRIAMYSLRVVFESDATNLVSSATSGHQIFARFAYNGPTTLVTVNAAGTGSANGPSHDAVITPDGRYVVFLSNATDLVSGVVANGLDQVYIRDLQAGVTKMVSVDNSGLAAGGLPSVGPLSVSDDGRYVAFTSNAILKPNDTNGLSDVYLRDVTAATTSLVSQTAATSLAGNGASFGGQVSRDGSVVLYTSRATDLQIGITDSNGVEDVYLWYRTGGFSQLVSSRRSNNAFTGNGTSTTADGGNFVSYFGDEFAFRSSTTDVVTGITYPSVLSNIIDINNSDGFSYRVDSADPTYSSAGNGNSNGPISFSFSGDVVAYQSAATNLSSGDTNGQNDIYAHIRTTNVSQLASRSTSGASGNGDSSEPHASDDGRYVVFSSHASDLDPLDTNGSVQDIFEQRLCSGYLVDRLDDADAAVPGSPACAAVGGGCTLRAAVDAANSNGGGLICLPSGRYPLTLGTLFLMADMTIDGDGSGSTLIDALQQTQAITVTLGGGARVHRNTERAQRGSHPRQAVNVTLNNLEIDNGLVDGDGAALFVDSDTAAFLNFVSFNGNHAFGDGGAIAVATAGELNAYGTDFGENFADGDGGGIANDGLLTLSYSRFFANSAGNSGGALYNSDSNGDGNASTVTETEFYGNTSGNAGGRAARASRPRTERAGPKSRQGFGSGGAIYNDLNTQLALSSVTAARNDATAGGAIYNAGTLDLTNGTISANRNGGGPGIGFGNGTVGLATILNSTITGNSFQGGGNEISNSGSTLRIKDSIVSGDPAVNCFSSGGNIVSQGNNIENGRTCGFTGPGDKQNLDPKLDPSLQYNGGFEQTHLLLAGSPAMDAGSATGFAPTDQRGVVRPQGASSDMGSVEMIGVTISDVSRLEGNSGTTAFVFTVTLSAPSPNSVTVDYATADGTASTEDNDYQQTSGTLTLGFTQQSQTITVLVNGDTKLEPNETFFVNLSNATGATISDGQGVGTILNDDGGAILLGPSPYLSKADSPFLADINAGRAYLDTFECGSLVVPGVTPSAGSVIPPSGITDSVDADDGAIDGSGTGGHSFFSGSGSAGITFTFSAATLGSLPTEAGVVWTDGAGTTTFEAFDAQGVSLGQVGPVAIADGSISGTTAEDRFFGVRFAGGISAIKISNTSGGIEVDHLQYGLYAATGADLSIAKTDSPDPVLPGAALTYTLAVSNAGPEAACRVTVVDTLPPGVTFGSVSGVGWACSQSAGVVTCTQASLGVGPAVPITIQVTAPLALGVITNAATVTSQTPDPVALNNVASATTTVGTALPVLSIGSVSVVKPASGTIAAVFPVSLSSASVSDVRVFYTTADGTAKAGVDYQAASSILFIPAGATTASITVLVNGNTIVSDQKTFTLSLFGPQNAVVGTGTGTGTIQDRNALPSLSIGDVAVAPGGSGTTPANFPVTLSPSTDRSVSVNYKTTDGTATAGNNDYVSTTGTLFFAPGETSKTITVPVVGKSFTSPSNFFVDLSPAVNAAVVRSRGTASISRSFPALSVGDAAVLAPGSSSTCAAFSINLSVPSTQAVTVSFATVDRTAIAGLDYTATSGAVTFAPGETTQSVCVPLLGLGSAAPTKVFGLTLSNPSGAIVAKNLGECALYDRSKPLPPGPYIFIDDVTVVRPGSSFAVYARVPVRLTGPSAVPINLSYATEGGSAHAGTDYLSTFGTLTISPGETLKTILVPVLRLPEGTPDRNFKVSLTDPFFGDVIPAPEATVTIKAPGL